MPRVIVAGGGLAGMAAAVALAEAGFDVRLFEARPFLGGRACSYPLPVRLGGPEIIDNCQHILLRCCTNLLDFYRRLGVADRIRFDREFRFLEPGGRMSTLSAGPLPAPLHLAASFCRLPFLSWRARAAIGSAFAAARRQWGRRIDLDRMSMGAWLADQRQPQEAIARFWRPVLVSAANAEPDAMAARHGLQLMSLAFLGRRDDYHMGVPEAPLGELYPLENLKAKGRLEVTARAPVERFLFDGKRASAALLRGEPRQADYYVSALPAGRAAAAAPELALDVSAFHYSPITSIRLWFDRPVTGFPHAVLLDRTMQWMFASRGGRHIQLVVSASDALAGMNRTAIIELALTELAGFMPGVGRAVLERAHVVKELRATFRPAPGLEAHRPLSATHFENLFLAGDWTRTGWPATMEGAVRSGYLAAEAVTRAAGAPREFLLGRPV